MKIIFQFIFLINLNAYAQFFDIAGKPLSMGGTTKNFTAWDIEKTNLKVTKFSAENPFEWAHSILSMNYPCTGGVVALPGYKQTDKVLVLTAGHCVYFEKHLDPKVVIENRDLSGQIQFSFPRTRKYLAKNLTTHQSEWVDESVYQFKKIIFASFDYVDLALFEMDLSYEQLDYRGNQNPPVLKAQLPAIGSTVKAFGIPQSDVYRSSLFHQAECRVIEYQSYFSEPTNVSSTGKYVHINSILNNCTLLPGMSGGYVRNESGDVIGVNGGRNLQGTDGQIYNYFNSVYPIAVCANGKGGFKTGCLHKLAEAIRQWDYDAFAKDFDPN